MKQSLLRACFTALSVVALAGGVLLPARAAQSASPYLVLIVMDGFRPDYQRLAKMPILHALMARGISYDTAWAGHLESETPSGHATIATGVYPRKHSVIGFGWRNVRTGDYTYPASNVNAVKAGILSSIIESAGVPTISDLIHARSKRDSVVSISGEKYYASAAMGVGADYVFYGTMLDKRFRAVSIGPRQPPAFTHYSSVSVPNYAFSLQDGFAADLAVRMVRSLRPRALLLNLPATDIAGHYFGGPGDPKDMAPIVRGADAAIGKIVRLYKRLGIYKRTIFVVTSDHGMVANHHIVPIHPMYALIRKEPVVQLRQEYRESAGFIWLRDRQHARLLASGIVAKHYNGVEGALYKVPSGKGWKFVADAVTARKLPKPLLRAYLNLADTEACDAGPEIVLPYVENGTGLVGGHGSLAGAHGGLSWGSQHIPLVIAGPGVRHRTSHFPMKLVDLAPTVERLMGLPVPAGVDGVVLADALTHPHSGDARWQQSVYRDRWQDVVALRSHSAAQTHSR